MGQVSFTLDIWSDSLHQSYLAIPAHWIAQVEGASTLKLKTALIMFHCLCQSHTGESLVRTLMYLLDMAGIIGGFKVEKFWPIIHPY